MSQINDKPNPSTNYSFLESILTKGLNPIKETRLPNNISSFANTNILNQNNQVDSISSFYLNGLTLRFVYYHCKSNSHWKLSSGF